MPTERRNEAERLGAHGGWVNAVTKQAMQRIVDAGAPRPALRGAQGSAAVGDSAAQYLRCPPGAVTRLGDQDAHGGWVKVVTKQAMQVCQAWH